MTPPRLGGLEQVELPTVWSNEASHFTPWLANAENIKLLVDPIGMELEVEVQRKDVGPFRSDSVSENTADAWWALVENQSERTGHVHLGQLIVGASSTDGSENGSRACTRCSRRVRADCQRSRQARDYCESAASFRNW